MHSAHMSRGTQHLTDRQTRSYEQTLFSNPLSHPHTHSGMHNHHHSRHSLNSCSLGNMSIDPPRAHTRACCPLREYKHSILTASGTSAHMQISLYKYKTKQKMSPIQHKICDDAAAQGIKWSPIWHSWGLGDNSPCVTSMITLPLIQCWANVEICK